MFVFLVQWFSFAHKHTYHYSDFFSFDSHFQTENSLIYARTFCGCKCVLPIECECCLCVSNGSTALGFFLCLDVCGVLIFMNSVKCRDAHLNPNERERES